MIKFLPNVMAMLYAHYLLNYMSTNEKLPIDWCNSVIMRVEYYSTLTSNYSYQYFSVRIITDMLLNVTLEMISDDTVSHFLLSRCSLHFLSGLVSYSHSLSNIYSHSLTFLHYIYLSRSIANTNQSIQSLQVWIDFTQMWFEV